MVRLDELFNTSYGNKFDLNKMSLATDIDINKINFISRSANNLGVSAIVKKVENIEPFKKGSITIALGGSILSSFIQQKPFYTAQNIMVLIPKKEMTFQEKLFYCICIERNRFRYSTFGREANRTLNQLELPDKVPSWISKIQEPDFSEYSKPLIEDKKIKINPKTWEKFRLGDLFNIYTGGDKPKKTDLKHKDGVLVNSVENLTKNNGVRGKIKYNGNKRFRNFISVVSIGEGGHAFYQAELGAIFTRVKALVPKAKTNLNPYVGMFIITLLNLEKVRYSYGRVVDKERLENSFISLPTKKEFEPDWNFMEDYIKSLKYSKGLDKISNLLCKR
ncbi:MAG: restriction endonuclease subunit S [Candidatus Nanoarchaeia archaeon]|nr:restriction endonuclease subunit S [Candidatus Nanoarchaeia archaeon]